MPVGRFLLQLVDLLPMPSPRTQRALGGAVVFTQGFISVTGAVVRVTASGLGCPTWPQCFPGSYVPIAVTEVPRIHQAIEFGNRMVTFAVVIASALAVLALTRARRRTEVLVYAWLMPASTVVQAVVGGITVRTGLSWWTVAVHLLLSMTMVWLAVLLFVKIGEPDSGVPRRRVPAALRGLTLLSAVTLSAVLVTGTLVTAAGPHAGDKSASRTVPRLKLGIVELAHVHESLLIAFVSMLIGLGFGLVAVRAARPVLVRLLVVIALACAQGLVGVVQYFTGVPAVLVVLHVAGAVLVTAATAALWASMRQRTQPEALQGGLDGERELPLPAVAGRGA